MMYPRITHQEHPGGHARLSQGHTFQWSWEMCVHRLQYPIVIITSTELGVSSSFESEASIRLRF